MRSARGQALEVVAERPSAWLSIRRSRRPRAQMEVAVVVGVVAVQDARPGRGRGLGQREIAPDAFAFGEGRHDADALVRLVDERVLDQAELVLQREGLVVVLPAVRRADDLVDGPR